VLTDDTLRKEREAGRVRGRPRRGETGQRPVSGGSCSALPAAVSLVPPKRRREDATPRTAAARVGAVSRAMNLGALSGQSGQEREEMHERPARAGART